MSKERKVMILAGAWCMGCVIGGITASAFFIAAKSYDYALAYLILALLSWWLGSSIAKVLKDSQPK